MFLFIGLTAFLYQKGSAESKKLDQLEPVDRTAKRGRNVPFNHQLILFAQNQFWCPLVAYGGF